jgi:hypothetical protein
VLGAAVSPSRMAGPLSQHLLLGDELGDKMAEGSAGFLLDRANIVIAGTSGAEQLVSRPAAAVFSVKPSSKVARGNESLRTGTKDGTPIYAAFSGSPITGWTVALRVPTATVQGPLRRPLVLLAGLAAFVTALGVVLAVAAARQIGRPIGALSKAAPHIVVGDQSVAIPRSSVTEVDEVGHAMLGALRERRPMATADVLSDARVELSPGVRAMIETEGYRAVLAAPLLVRATRSSARWESVPFRAVCSRTTMCASSSNSAARRPSRWNTPPCTTPPSGGSVTPRHC